MFYDVIKIFLKIAITLLYRVRVSGLDHFPKDGAVMLCGNHIHLFDPVVLIAKTRRKLHFMAKKEAFDNKLLGYLLNKVKAIELDRKGADLAAYKAAIRYLKNKEVVGVFVQGTRMAELDVASAKQGAALFALKGNACIMPVYIEATYKIFSEIVVRFGEPLYLEKYKEGRAKSEVLEEITQDIVNSILKLQVV